MHHQSGNHIGQPYQLRRTDDEVGEGGRFGRCVRVRFVAPVICAICWNSLVVGTRLTKINIHHYHISILFACPSILQNGSSVAAPAVCVGEHAVLRLRPRRLQWETVFKPIDSFKPLVLSQEEEEKERDTKETIEERNGGDAVATNGASDAAAAADKEAADNRRRAKEEEAMADSGDKKDIGTEKSLDESNQNIQP